jgi:hypothetical protein
MSPVAFWRKGDRGSGAVPLSDDVSTSGDSGEKASFVESFRTTRGQLPESPFVI